MTPKIIHLCWFSDDPYPVEIQACLKTWRHLLPDYKVRLWDADAARSIGCPFIDEALRRHRWAYAADAYGVHCIYGSWRKRRFGRRIELALKHALFWVKFRILGMYR